MKNHSILKLLSLALAFTSATAFAHLEKGRYAGTAQDGSACGFEVLDVQFEGGVKHPLNERVQIDVGGTKWELRHLPQLDVQAGKIGFDGHHLSGAFATPAGQFAVVLWMDHSEGFNGPRILNVIHQGSSGATKYVCADLHKAE